MTISKETAKRPQEAKMHLTIKTTAIDTHKASDEPNVETSISKKSREKYVDRNDHHVTEIAEIDPELLPLILERKHCMKSEDKETIIDIRLKEIDANEDCTDAQRSDRILAKIIAA